MKGGQFNWDSIPVKTGVTADPAAGAEPNGLTTTKRMRIYDLSFDLVTDANVADRTVVMTVKYDGTSIDYYIGSSTVHTASLTRVYTWIPSKTWGESKLGSYYMMGLGLNEPMELPVGAVIAFTVSNKQAGDNASVTRYSYKEIPA